MIGREVNSKKIKNILNNLNIAKNFILISEKKELVIILKYLI